MQGTSKPTKYIVLCDDAQLTSDQIEIFCFYACHNCMRTKDVIGHPTPVRYADLCAYRAKFHIEAKREQTERDDASTTTSTSTANSDEIHRREVEIIRQFSEWCNVSENRRQKFYYC